MGIVLRIAEVFRIEIILQLREEQLVAIAEVFRIEIIL
jgi:hypothetical protein